MMGREARSVGVWMTSLWAVAVKGSSRGVVLVAEVFSISETFSPSEVLPVGVEAPGGVSRPAMVPGRVTIVSDGQVTASWAWSRWRSFLEGAC